MTPTGSPRVLTAEEFVVFVNEVLQADAGSLTEAEAEQVSSLIQHDYAQRQRLAALQALRPEIERLFVVIDARGAEPSDALRAVKLLRQVCQVIGDGQ